MYNAVNNHNNLIIRGSMHTYIMPVIVHDSIKDIMSMDNMPEYRYLAGGWVPFEGVILISRDNTSRARSASSKKYKYFSIRDFEKYLCNTQDERLTSIYKKMLAKRMPVSGIDMDTPRCMTIINATPDSFSDGKPECNTIDYAEKIRQSMNVSSFIDIGGESTRPGAHDIDHNEEHRRVAPIFSEIYKRQMHMSCAFSIDTRKTSVAEMAFSKGATIMNDVSGLNYDPSSIPFIAQSGKWVCVVHSQGTPGNMQDNPEYEDVVLDVFDFFENKIAQLEKAGISSQRIIIDPGIGFGKNTSHNVKLIKNIAIFHGLGCPILVGASRKRFLGELSCEPDATKRDPQTASVAIYCVSCGVQIHRLHNPEIFVKMLSVYKSLYSI